MSTGHSVETVGGSISSATLRLRAAGFPSPHLDAELLMGFLLGKSRTRLVVDANEPIDENTRVAFDMLVDRRHSGRPIAYLIGRREFMGHDFVVGPGVLIPRPETELLVERAVMLIDRHWARKSIRVLDICTGSGAIALSLALRTDRTRVQIVASDLSSNALRYARINRANLDLANRVTLVRADLLEWTRGPWDLILANPPYLRPDQIDGNVEISTEPRLALDGGRNGIELIERIIRRTPAVAASKFAMLIELDPDHAESVRALAVESFPNAHIEIIVDLAGRARLLSIENGFQNH